MVVYMTSNIREIIQNPGAGHAILSIAMAMSKWSLLVTRVAIIMQSITSLLLSVVNVLRFITPNLILLKFVIYAVYTN